MENRNMRMERRELAAVLALLCLGAAVPAWKNQKQASTFDANGLEAMKGLDQGSAKLQMVFSLLLSLGLFIAGLL